jgi:hypothetical protein
MGNLGLILAFLMKEDYTMIYETKRKCRNAGSAKTTSSNATCERFGYVEQVWNHSKYTDLVNLAPEAIEQVAWSMPLSAIPKGKDIFFAPFSKEQGWLFEKAGSIALFMQ